MGTWYFEKVLIDGRRWSPSSVYAIWHLRFLPVRILCWTLGVFINKDEQLPRSATSDDDYRIGQILRCLAHCRTTWMLIVLWVRAREAEGKCIQLLCWGNRCDSVHCWFSFFISKLCIHYLVQINDFGSKMGIIVNSFPTIEIQCKMIYLTWTFELWSSKCQFISVQLLLRSWGIDLGAVVQGTDILDLDCCSICWNISQWKYNGKKA